MRKKEKKREEIDTQAWMISFSDLLTLILTFFVLLFSMSSMNNLEFSYYMGSLQGALGTLGRGKFTSIGKPKFISISSLPTEELALIEDSVIRALLLKSDKQEDTLIDNNFETLEIYANNKYAQIFFPSEIVFQKNSVKICPKMKSKLEKIAAVLKKFPHPIRINGYSHQPLPESGIDLSTKRAASILRFLTNRGIAPVRCSLAGYGNLRVEGRKNKNEDYVELFIIKPTNYSV